MKGVKEVDRHQSQSTYSTQCDSNNADESTSTAVCDEDGNKLDSTEEIIEQRGTIIGVSSVSEFDDDDFDSFDEQSPYGDEIREEIREICNEVKALPNFDNTWERSTNELNSALNSTVTNESDEVRPSVAASNKRFSTLSTPADDRHAIPLSPTKKFTTHLVIDADSAYPSDASDSSPSSASSNADGQICPVRKSCPDLRLSAGSQCRNFEAHQIHGPHEQRSKIKRLTTQWSTKPLSEWTLDDVILWLQSCKLDEVASIIIGYDIGGSDIENWDDAALIQLGIIGEETRRTLLAELSTIKERQMKTSNSVSRLHSSKDKTRLPLFSLVRSDNYDQVIAVETSLSTRDITVAEGRLGCLQVTKVNGANIPLCEQDCFLEINGRPGRGFRSPLMFTKLVSEAAGEPIRIVVLRRRCSTKEVHGDSPESAEYLQQTLSNTEKVSGR
ncbi:hypothetical protein AB6A40_007108 [Gnathostoma spinigerum]|uniref:SAM domain-containing protein n=1 Tax=Gnathostoma spinigerum TaxID=75299 RepID=A0ABD6EKA2_9BILA